MDIKVIALLVPTGRPWPVYTDPRCPGVLARTMAVADVGSYQDRNMHTGVPSAGLGGFPREI